MSLRLYVIPAACLIAVTASAFALGLHDFAITYSRYDPGSRVPTAPGYALTQGIEVGFEISQGIDPLMDAVGLRVKLGDRLFYWRNVVHGAMESAQFRSVGWEYEFGIRPVPWIEIGRFHHSQHLLDVGYPWPGVGGFPVEDGFFLRLRLAE